MKGRTLLQPTQQTTHISPASIQAPFGWNKEQKAPARSRLVDSYSFLMGLINAESSPVRYPKKKANSYSNILNVTYGDSYKENCLKASN